MKALRILLFVVLLVGLFVFGFAWRDLQRGQLPPARALSGLTGAPTAPPKQSPEEAFRTAYRRILEDYVGEVKAEDLKYAGMEGLVASLGDPHTVFMVPRLAQEFTQDTRGNFVGIGARLSPDPLGAKIVTVFEDGPAFAAGLRTNDVVTAVDGKSVAGEETDAIVGKIRGVEGTEVRLGILKAGKGQPVTLTIRRAQITIPSVTGKVLADSGFGYIEINQFSEPTVEQFDRVLEKLNAESLPGLVIDVRSNPGGLLESAADVLSRFVSNKPVVTMRHRNGDQETVRTSRNDTRKWPMPVVVLMNEDSASAAEIFAGVLRDYRMATLVGEHSYGKASVQTVRGLVDQSSVKITIAKYFLPSTPDISRKVDEDGVYVSGGLQPDVKVEPTRTGEFTPGDPKTDNQLQKAIEVLKEKRG